MPNTEQPATFEREMWHMLARHGLPGNKQTSIGNAMLRLAGEYLGIKPDRPAGRKRRLIAGKTVHYFPPSGAEPRPDDSARCGRVERDQLKPGNATENVMFATCNHCKKAGLADRHVT